MASPVPHNASSEESLSSSPLSSQSLRSLLSLEGISSGSPVSDGGLTPSAADESELDTSLQEITSGSPVSDGGLTPSAGDESELDTDVESSIELSADDDASDFEETLKKKSRKTRRRVLRQATKRVRRDVGDIEDLFEAIIIGRSAIQILVEDWLDSYNKDREAAVLGLINFIIKACGCKGVVTKDMMETMQNAEIIWKMTEDFDENSADYPLSLSSRPWKRFRVNFGEFVGKLVTCSQYNVLYDGIALDMLISFLTGLSDSQVRAFRHTSTYAAMKMLTALVKVARDLSHHLETSQRQFSVEEAKSPEKRSAETLETLLEKMTEMHSNLEEIGNMMNNLFKGVFVLRYRDIHPDVRALCLKELGFWIAIYPQSFLNDGYLKYLGWMLHDKQGDVRLQCLRSLQELYSVPQWAGKLELFTSRFKNRVVSMALDKEHLVSAAAIQLIGLIYKNMETFLSNEDHESIYPLVYTSSRAVAVAAGNFVYQSLLDTSDDENAPQRSNLCSTQTYFFHLLIDFFISSELPDHAAYLVDSLWDSAATRLRDWECQTDILLMKKSCLDDHEESALANILVSSIRQAVEGTSPAGRVPIKKTLSAKDKKTHSEDKLRLSRHMIVTLPHLLAKFSADKDKVTTLLTVVEYLDLEIYSLERLDKSLDFLLNQVHNTLEKHTESVVLEACSRVLYMLCDQQLAFCKKTDIMLSQLVDKLCTQFHNQLSDILQVTDLDEEDIYNAAATMKRLAALYSAHDLTRWEFFDPCSDILQKAIDTSEVPEQIVLPALVCCHFSLLWELSHFCKFQPSKDELASLRQRLLLFLTTCQTLLSDIHCSVREQAFKLLSDLLVIFNDGVGCGDRSYLQTLSYSPDLPLQAELAGFLVDHVFTISEEEESGDESHKIQRLNERRILLAGYCKLILYNALELRFASDVYKYYVKFYTDYGDIIKETLRRSRKVSREESTRTVLLCLTQVYTGLSLEDISPDRRYSLPFLDIQNLARHFSLLLGPDQIRIREDVVLLHKEGIQFSLRISPGVSWSAQNLLFLDVLSEFSPKLLKQDKIVIFQYLEEMCQQCIPPEDAFGIDDSDELWAPLFAYKKSLTIDIESVPSTPGTREAKEGMSPVISLIKKRRFSKEDSSSGSLADEEDSQSPLMSSTVLRRRMASRSPTDDRTGSDSDFDTSEYFKIRRLRKSAQTSGRMQGETPFALAWGRGLHGLSLTQEGEEQDAIIIDDGPSCSTSSAGEEEQLDIQDTEE